MAILEDVAKALATGTPGQAIGISPDRTAVPITAGGASPSPSNATPQPIGAPTAGTSADYARGDHVHAAALADLSDVAATAPTSGQVLAWGGSEWAPATPSAAPSPSSATPQPIGTAAAGTSTDYSRGDHVHAAAVTALSDRFERLPLQASSEFAAPTVRDVQTAIDAHTSGAAAVVVLAPGSYPGATVTINGARANFAICGPVGQPFGGTIATLSAGRGLSVGGTCQRIRLSNIQIEGLTTWNPSGAGVHRVDRCQLLGGLTLGTSWPVGTYLVITDCAIAGTITIPAGFPGVVLFDRTDFTGATFAIGAGVVAQQISISSCTGLATVPSPATINAFNGIGTSVQAFFNGSQGTSGQVLTSAGAGAAPTWQTPSGSGIAYIDHTVNLTTTNNLGGSWGEDKQVSGLVASAAYLLDYCEIDNVGGSATQIGLLAATTTQTPTVSIPATQQQAAIFGSFSSAIAVSSLPILDGTTGTYCGPRPGFSGSPVAPAVVTTDTAGRLNLRGITNISGGSFRAKIRLRKVSP
jgi:hypothetical protein